MGLAEENIRMGKRLLKKRPKWRGSGEKVTLPPVYPATSSELLLALSHNYRP